MSDDSPMNDRTRGAWILHHAAKLQQVTEPGQYDDLSTAGKAGVLLSCLSASSQRQLTNAQVDAFARAHGISPKTEVPTLLGFLEERRLISRGDQEIEVLGVTSSKVLEHTAGLFDSLSPTPQQQAAIEMAETISSRPAEKSELLEVISDGYALS
ncbi:MAG TPA: hypothetical protein VMT18_06590, partial [Planctomycetota bacterium]|nr:hypothetical protein [Planctomycetota bacterium]